MYDPVIKNTIEQLHQTGKSIREISRFLNLSRNTVRTIIRQKAKPEYLEEHHLLELIRTLVASCQGNLVRVHESLAFADHAIIGRRWHEDWRPFAGYLSAPTQPIPV